MKILIAINQSRVLYDFKRELVDALAARGAEVILTLKEDFRAEYFKRKNYRILPAPIDPRGMNPLSDAKLSRFYRELLTKERPDVALTFTIKPNVYCGRQCAKLGIPYYATISGLGSALNGALPLRALASFLYRRGLRGAERVFCQNAAIATWAESRGVATKERIEEIPGSGVDLTRFRALPYPEEEEGATILFIGRLMRDKDPRIRGVREEGEGDAPDDAFFDRGGAGDGVSGIRFGGGSGERGNRGILRISDGRDPLYREGERGDVAELS